MRRPRVLIDASCLSDARAGAGIGRYARELIAALSSRGDVDLEVVVPGRAPRSESRPGRFLHAHPAVLRTALRWKPQIVHGVGGEPLLGFPLARQLVTLHDVEMWRRKAPGGVRGAALGAYRRVLPPLYRRAGGLIAVSATTAREAGATLGLDATRLHVIPHGVSPCFDDSPGAGDAAILGALRVAPPYIVWSGSLRFADPRKGIDVLLRAAAELDADVTLALAGATGEEAQRVVRSAVALGVRAVLCGSLSDESLAAVYRGAATLALPSLHEGFGLPMLEAMACGTPVVSTTAGNLSELSGGAALLVPPNDARALAAGLRTLLGDKDTAQALRTAGLARAAGFSWARTADLTAGVYRELARVG
jgi:glycosyltransferase involved in cell wall biosynthesis